MRQFALYFGSFGGNGERQLIALAIFGFKMALLARGFGVAFAMALLSIEFIALLSRPLARQNKQRQARKTNKRNQAGKIQRANRQANLAKQSKQAKQ